MIDPKKPSFSGTPSPRRPHLAVLRGFERSGEQGEAHKTGELAENRRFFDNRFFDKL